MHILYFKYINTDVIAMCEGHDICLVFLTLNNTTITCLFFSTIESEVEKDSFKMKAAKLVANSFGKRFSYNTFKRILLFMTILVLYQVFKQLGSTILVKVMAS